MSPAPRTDALAVSMCQVCATALPQPSLDLGLQPLCDDLVVIGDDRQTIAYPVQISICPNCLTAHQRFNVPKEKLFPRTYHYRARFTQDVLDGMRDLVDQCTFLLSGCQGKLVCDVGCNDGSLLSLFRTSGAATGGIEPTDAANDASAAGHFVIQNYFSPESAGAFVVQMGHPDVVTFTNVFAHLENLQDSIAALKVLVKPSTFVVIENHYLGSVLEGGQFDTFYHEHPRTYSLRSFEHICEQLGAEIVDVRFPKRYGGNIRVTLGRFSSVGRLKIRRPPSQPHRDESSFPAQLAAMQRWINTWKVTTRAEIDRLAAGGIDVRGKSFPGRASILINLLGLDAGRHPFVYEKPGSMKIGHYLPGTRIQIAADECWISGRDRPDAMIVWGWHIADEIASYVRARGFNGALYQPLPVFQPL